MKSAQVKLLLWNPIPKLNEEATPLIIKGQFHEKTLHLENKNTLERLFCVKEIPRTLK